jgi:rhamnosyltransferase
MNLQVFAIVVAFNPDIEVLSRLCAQLNKFAKVIVVDNSPPENDVYCIKGTYWHSMGGNAGIAAAQNAGIRLAINEGAGVLAFFDQDSEPDEQLLPTLVAALGQPPHGVAAPVCVDSRTGNEYSAFKFNRWGWASPAPAFGLTAPVFVDMIISSGSVVEASVFRQVGMMEEAFFIDYVDLEWCIRCKNAGLPIRVVPSAIMTHSIGDNVVKKGILTLFVHSPARAYYRLRNAFLLMRFSHVPHLFVIHEIAAAVVHHVLLWRHSQDRWQHLRMGWRGLVDGLLGIRGKFQVK